jgi:hypothetical protein
MRSTAFRPNLLQFVIITDGGAVFRLLVPTELNPCFTISSTKLKLLFIFVAPKKYSQLHHDIRTSGTFSQQTVRKQVLANLELCMTRPQPSARCQHHTPLACKRINAITAMTL